MEKVAIDRHRDRNDLFGTEAANRCKAGIALAEGGVTTTVADTAHTRLPDGRDRNKAWPEWKKQLQGGRHSW